MKTFRQHLDEKTEYYLDTSQDNTERFVAYDGASWYTGKVGVKGENMCRSTNLEYHKEKSTKKYMVESSTSWVRG